MSIERKPISSAVEGSITGFFGIAIFDTFLVATGYELKSSLFQEFWEGKDVFELGAYGAVGGAILFLIANLVLSSIFKEKKTSSQ